jgi:hypothetical protein
MKNNTLTKNQVAIVVFTLITAFIHLVVLNTLMGKVDLLFTLNGLGYLGLLAAYFLPFVRNYRTLVRWAFMAFTLVTIVAWLAIGDKTLPGGALGYFTKLDELALVIALWRDR